MFKKFAVTMATAAMVAASAMTAMAATTTYFYVYENGTFRAARMGQDCVANVAVDENEVTMELQAGSYNIPYGTYAGDYVGTIEEAWIDNDGDGVFGSGDESLLESDVITYNQEELATTVEGSSYANFYIEVKISKVLQDGTMEDFAVKTQDTYVPMQ